MNLVRRSLSKWIEAALILVVAILLIVAGVQGLGKESESAINAISTVLGIVLIVAGALSAIVGFIAATKFKKSVGLLVAPGASLIAIGISMVVLQYAGNLIGLTIRVVPYLLVVGGIIAILDAIVNMVRASKGPEKKAVLLGIPGIIYGVICVVLGFLCLLPNSKNPVISFEVQVIVVGIILAILAVIITIVSFIKPKQATVIVDLEKEEDK